ncbi:MAG: 2-C-methyl-D-erythritol 4-phosphate cytidylyltransferase [Desulfovibrio sp.]|nr:2-C-methyl-D-erythritol 4-phosphate cytidylyltransferase [Desulfovibrio sp.]
MSPWAIIVAAGKGERMKTETPKQFVIWRDRPLYWHSAVAFSRSSRVKGIVFVFHPDYLEREKERLRDLIKTAEVCVPWLVAPGGARRQDSVRAALESLPPECDLVFVHDAARPFLSPRLVHRIADSLAPEMAGVIPCVDVTDTIKSVGKGACIGATIPRHTLLAAQTPQLFRRRVLQKAHETTGDFTDDAGMLEAMGEKIGFCEGERSNVKLTYPEDLDLLREKDDMINISGFGYDVHKFGGDKPLRLGGVPIPGALTITAHSDGDVVLHALMDAILGCVGRGDLGDHFPDTDPALAGVSSAILLDEVLDLAREARFVIDHVDITIIAQKPRLAARKKEISNNIARLLGLSTAMVNIKATTEEGMGFTGRKEGIKCCALVNGRMRRND